MNEHQISNNISNAVTDNLEYLISYVMLSQMKSNSLCKDFISHFEDVTNTQIKGHKVMNNIQESEFASWYDRYDKRTPQDPFDRWLAHKAWDAALASPKVQMLRDALKVANDTLESISDEMTVGDRWTNAGQDLLDALPVTRNALAAMEEQK